MQSYYEWLEERDDRVAEEVESDLALERELPGDAAACLMELGLTEDEAEMAISDYYAGY